MCGFKNSIGSPKRVITLHAQLKASTSWLKHHVLSCRENKLKMWVSVKELFKLIKFIQNDRQLLQQLEKIYLMLML